MKFSVAIIGLVVAFLNYASAQGLLNFHNTSQTLISAGGGVMPVRTSFDTTFYFGLFLAPSDTDVVAGIYDPNWQTVTAYSTNHTSPVGEGRIVLQYFLDTGHPANTTVDILVRGWSASVGTTWAEALQTLWNIELVGVVPGYYYGESLVGQNVPLGDGLLTPAVTIFGANSFQLPGFNLSGIPEPSALAFSVLAAVMLGLSRRR